MTQNRFPSPSLASALAIASIAVAGCGTPPVDNAWPTTPVAQPTVHRSDPSAPCGAGDACYAEGKKAHDAGDDERAREFFQYGCDQNDGASCVTLGSMLDRTDPKALELFQKACAGKSADGCFDVAERSRRDDPAAAIGFYKKACDLSGPDLKDMACARGAETAYRAQDFQSAQELAKSACGDAGKSGCMVLGVMAANGEGMRADRAMAAKLFDLGCKAGQDEACANAKKLGTQRGSSASSGTDLSVDDANLSMGSMVVDGFTMKDIACKTDDGGLGALMAGPAISAAIGSKKAQLRACSAKGGEARVRFKMTGGRTSNVEAKADSPAIEACVVNVMKTVPSPMGGTCALTLVLDRK